MSLSSWFGRIQTCRMWSRVIEAVDDGEKDPSRLAMKPEIWSSSRKTLSEVASSRRYIMYVIYHSDLFIVCIVLFKSIMCIWAYRLQIIDFIDPGVHVVKNHRTSCPSLTMVTSFFLSTTRPHFKIQQTGV